ncbi:WD40 domain-containing protein denticleless isoform X1 [Leptinotarsa decemlineata]|uniref:WD40 domain-containing protein denticleless isoform X1 n=2 Tax=Leptinotarsa decemlineata TaxID=7539 RepID=UPI003D308EEC
MLLNDAQTLFSQQGGFSYWRNTNAPIKRLRCTRQNSYCQLLPQSEQDELVRDTPIFTCKFSPQEGNEHFLALANEDGKLAVQDIQSKERYGVHAHNNAIFDLAWMFDRMKLVTASGDHTSKMYDIGNGEITAERMFCGHTRSVKTVAFRKDDSNVFATGGRDGNIILWDTRTETNSFIGRADGIISNSHTSRVFTPSKSRKKFSTPTNSGTKSVTGLVFQETNTLISCGAGDGILKIWDLRKNYTIHKREAAPKTTIPYPGISAKNGYSSIIIDNEGIKLYANCLDNTIYCYNVGAYSNEPVMRYTGHQNNTFYVKSSLSKNSSHLISGSSDENAYIWDTKLSRPIVKLTGHSAEVTCVSWCSKDFHIITCSDDMTHKLWTVEPEELPEDWEVNGRGEAEVLPLNECGKCSNSGSEWDYGSLTPRKLNSECSSCHKTMTATRCCENCGSKVSKRKSIFRQESANKVFHTEFGPRRLFPPLNNLQNLNTENLAKSLENGNSSECTEDYEPPTKMRKLSDASNANCQLSSLSDSCESTEETWHHKELPASSTDENFEPPTKLPRLEIISEESEVNCTSSPTINLPNFVVDGSAPHLTYSPPKKKSQDWLTRIRIEKMLRQEMYDKTVGASSPKLSKPESNSRGKKCLNPKSPILKYFKVTNSPHKCEGACSKYQNCSSNFNATDLRRND